MKTYKGTDGVERTLDAHRGHLQAELDLAVDSSSPRFDEGFGSRLRAQLTALPKRSPPEQVARVTQHKPTGKSAPRVPRYALVLIDADAIADIEAFRHAGPDSVLAMTKKKIKVTCLMRRVLRAVLTARVEREAP